MKKYLAIRTVLFMAFSFTLTGSFAQNLIYHFVEDQRKFLKEPTKPVSVLEPANNPLLSSQLNGTLSGFDLFTTNPDAVSSLFNSHPASISFQIASTEREYQLELIQQDINTSGDFAVNMIEDGRIASVSHSQGLHYRGYIKGDPNSIASLSVFQNGDLMIVFSNTVANFNLGKLKGSPNYYVLFQQGQMNTPLGFNCHTDELGKLMHANPNSSRVGEIPPAQGTPALLCEKVRFYWEATNKLYFLNFGSDSALTMNYITGVFNQVATMYLNEGIKVELAATSIWRTIDPYDATSSSTALNGFRSRWNLMGNNFNGNLAMLIDGGSSNNGGIAYLLDDLCWRTYNYGYANVYGSFNTVPTYSWDVEVLTHEIGHNLGSHHTHWCGWMTGIGGTCGAIDNCYTLETTTGCSSCLATTNTIPSAPAGWKGTVMSYCHLRSGIGINLANGFGPLPQSVIRSVISGSSICMDRNNLWTGAVSTAWEVPENWSCNSIPDATTDVVLPTGLTNYPVVNSQAICRKLVQPAGTTVRVTTGYKLTIVGN